MVSRALAGVSSSGNEDNQKLEGLSGGLYTALRTYGWIFCVHEGLHYVVPYVTCDDFLKFSVLNDLVIFYVQYNFEMI